MITKLPTEPVIPSYDSMPEGDVILVHGLPKVGKCHGKGTKILMHDGTIKNVEEVMIGDKLMGDDSSPRNVLKLGNGKSQMYDVVPVWGDKYVCNEPHILCLKQNRKHNGGVNGTVVEMTVGEYNKLSDSSKHFYKGYHVPVEFEEKDVRLEPYFLGIWLSDGCSDNQSVWTPDEEVINYLQEYAKKIGYTVTITDQENNESKRISVVNSKGKKNILLDLLRDYNLINNKHIPLCYKANSRKVRLELLAGLLDGDGYLGKKPDGQRSIEITFKSEKLIDDVIYLCRSLGFSATKHKKIGRIKAINFEGEYWRSTINGSNLHEIPNSIERKKISKREYTKDVLRTAIKISPNGTDDYYGFMLDGNGRYLLGDFTVTHNTTYLASWPDNCILEVERGGAKWTKGAMVVEVENLKDLDQAIKLLKVDKRFKAVSLDTVDTLSLWIEKDICNKFGVSSISLAGGGYGIGRNELNTRLIGLIDDLVDLGKTVILVSHCRDNQGTKSLMLTETLLTYIQGKASIIGYAYKELVGGRLEFMIDYSGGGTVSAAGSRNKMIGRAGPMPNTYQAIEKLFTPRPAKWAQMLKWYEKKGITVEEYANFITDKISSDAEIETLNPGEIKILIQEGAKHLKHEEEFDAFKKKYSTKKEEKGE